MLRDMFVFVSGLYAHWAALFGGTILSVAIMYVEYRRNKKILWRHIVWVMLAALVISCFLTWRDEYRRAESSGTEVARLNGVIQTLGDRREDNAKDRNGLADLIRRGVAIRNKTSMNQIKAAASILSEWHKWIADVDIFLRTNLDAADAEIFKSYQDLFSPDTQIPLHMTIANEIGQLERFLEQIER